MKKIILLSAVSLLLSACVTRLQTETGAMSINQGKFMSNAELVYSSGYVGACAVSEAERLDSGNYSIPLEPLETQIICKKGGAEKVMRTVQPVMWKTKYDSSRNSAMASSFIFGGPLALAIVGGTTPSQPDLEDIPPMHRIYPPFMAVVSKNASSSERSKARTAINSKFKSYYENMPADCEDWNQRGYNALCEPDMIEILRDHELAYIDGREFKMPEKTKSQEEAAKAKEEDKKEFNE